MAVNKLDSPSLLCIYIFIITSNLPFHDFYLIESWQKSFQGLFTFTPLLVVNADNNNFRWTGFFGQTCRIRKRAKLHHVYCDLANAYCDLAYAYCDLAHAYCDLAHAYLILLMLIVILLMLIFRTSEGILWKSAWAKYIWNFLKLRMSENCTTEIRRSQGPGVHG